MIAKVTLGETSEIPADARAKQWLHDLRADIERWEYDERMQFLHDSDFWMEWKKLEPASQIDMRVHSLNTYEVMLVAYAEDCMRKGECVYMPFFHHVAEEAFQMIKRHALDHRNETIPADSIEELLSAEFQCDDKFIAIDVSQAFIRAAIAFRMSPIMSQ